MKFVTRSEVYGELLGALNPLVWHVKWPERILHCEQVGEGLFEVSICGLMGLRREITLQYTEDSGLARLDIVESDWLTGSAVVASDSGGSGWTLEVNLSALSGISGTLAKEFCARFKPTVASLIATENAL